MLPYCQPPINRNTTGHGRKCLKLWTQIHFPFLRWLFQTCYHSKEKLADNERWERSPNCRQGEKVQGQSDPQQKKKTGNCFLIQKNKGAIPQSHGLNPEWEACLPCWWFVVCFCFRSFLVSSPSVSLSGWCPLKAWVNSPMDLQLMAALRQGLFTYWEKYIRLLGAGCGCLLWLFVLKKEQLPSYRNKCLLI